MIKLQPDSYIKNSNQIDYSINAFFKKDFLFINHQRNTPKFFPTIYFFPLSIPSLFFFVSNTISFYHCPNIEAVHSTNLLHPLNLKCHFWQKYIILRKLSVSVGTGFPQILQLMIFALISA